jgi:hypothetical protein
VKVPLEVLGHRELVDDGQSHRREHRVERLVQLLGSLAVALGAEAHLIADQVGKGADLGGV